MMTGNLRAVIGFAACLAFWCAGAAVHGESGLVLKDGRILQGKVIRVATITADPDKGGAQLILMVDNELCRYFIPRQQLARILEDEGSEPLQKFHVPQRRPNQLQQVASVGPPLDVEPFNEFGRRTYRMATAKGVVPVIQGITQITPKWTKVEGISHVWDMRIATTSIPRAEIDQILSKIIDRKNIEHRLGVVRFYVQGDRYRDAQAELDGVIQDFPQTAGQYKAVADLLRQRSAQTLLDEVKLRASAAQYRLVMGMLEHFPTAGVAGEILQEVRATFQSYEERLARVQRLSKQLDQQLAALPEAEQIPLRPLLLELQGDLSLNTVDRLGAYEQLANDASLHPSEKLALAISGWLVGKNDSTVKLPVATSLHRVRNLVAAYLNETVKLKRDELLRQLASEEGGTPNMVAKLLALMKPPTNTATSPIPGFYELTTPGPPGGADYQYVVQLPPEYDPNRRYPTVVTLHGAGLSPTRQLDWWAGSPDAKGVRQGQSGRHGYIVVSPAWGREHQKKYDYAQEAHACVLNTLRDACRRFSIDTDRVFLSGHSMGGDAAWDIGISHPDLWAGVIPIVARGDRYVKAYTDNARRMPIYLVAGEKDGDSLAENAGVLDKYLTYGFNCTLCEYLGRGHEYFSDEVIRLFDWMNRYRREFYPKEFTARALRVTDNFFWWVELGDMPSRLVVHPSEWEQRDRRVGLDIEAKILENNGVWVKAGAGKITVWITPDLLDLSKRAEINVNGRKLNRNGFLEPDLPTLLEDARTRADRQRPFWLKYEVTNGRFADAG